MNILKYFVSTLILMFCISKEPNLPELAWTFNNISEPKSEMKKINKYF